MRMQKKAKVSLVPAAPKQRPAGPDERVLIASYRCGRQCNSCAPVLPDKFSVLGRGLLTPLAVSLDSVTATRVQGAHVLVEASPRTLPTACPIVARELEQTCWDEQTCWNRHAGGAHLGWVPKVRPPTAVLGTNHTITQCGTSSAAHRPNCLDDELALRLPVAWVLTEFPHHRLLLYNTCPEHCPGHIMQRSTISKAWHSLHMLLGHCRAKNLRADQTDEVRDAQHKEMRELMKLQKEQRHQIKKWAASHSLG